MRIQKKKLRGGVRVGGGGRGGSDQGWGGGGWVARFGVDG